MVSRRNFVSGPAIASYSRHSAKVDYEQISDRALQDFTNAIKEVSAAIRGQQSFDEIFPVRQKQLDLVIASSRGQIRCTVKSWRIAQLFNDLSRFGSCDLQIINWSLQLHASAFYLYHSATPP